MSNGPTTPERAVHVMQILAGAFVAGVVLFAAVAVVIAGTVNRPADGQIVSLIAIGFAMLMFLMHLIVPGAMARQAAQQSHSSGDEMAWYGMYQARLVVGLAMLEGAAFFSIVAYIVEQHWWSLAVAGALAFWMLAAFPTRGRVEQWIETQRMERELNQN